MTYKTILVQIDDSAHHKTSVRVAADLASRFDAHLIGVYSLYDEAVRYWLQDPSFATELAKRAEKARERADQVSTEFFQGMQSTLYDRAEFRRVDQDPLTAIGIQARYADLLVVGQRDPDEKPSGVPVSFVENSVLAAGRPVLVVPYFTNSYPRLGTNVLVAWDGSREAGRAVRDALPLLQQAQQVIVMSVNPSVSPREHGEVPGAEMALYLARHGVKAEARPSYAVDISVADELSARASDLDIDLLVMGAYGHSRLQEVVLGGVTRTLLRHMTVPILMSH